MECFGGCIYEGNAKLEGHVFDPNSTYYQDLMSQNPQLIGSDFAKDGYFTNNFNDVVAAYVTLFELMVVNQWHILTSGFVILTNESARLFFLAFHLTAVVLMLNIFVAFILEAFLMQLQLFHGVATDDLYTKVQAFLEAQAGSSTGRAYVVEPRMKY